MSIAGKISRNTGFVFVSDLTNKLLSVAFVVYAARVLGPADFGLYALLGSFSFFFTFFGNLGVGPMAIREIARNRDRSEGIFNHVISLRLALVLVSYPALIFVTYLLNYDDELRFLIIITGLSSIFSVFSHSFGILYVAFERFKAPSLINMLVAFINTVAGIVVLYLGYGLRGIVLISLFGNIVGMVISNIWVRQRVIKYKLSIELKAWRHLLGQAMPFAILSFFQQASNYVNIMFLSKLPGPLPGDVAIGYYNPSLSLCRAAMLLPESFRKAALPSIASNSENRVMHRELIRRSSEILFILIVCPLIFVTNFFPKDIIAIVFGHDYLPSASALPILGWAFGLQVLLSPVTATLSASREIHRFIPWVIFTFSINFICSLPLIIYFGFVGAAIAFLLSRIVDAMVKNYLLYRILGVKIL